MTPAALAPYFEAVGAADLMRRRGRVKSLIGLVIEATGLRAEVGELCTISAGRNAEPMQQVGDIERLALVERGSIEFQAPYDMDRFGPAAEFAQLGGIGLVLGAHAGK